MSVNLQDAFNGETDVSAGRKKSLLRARSHRQSLDHDTDELSDAVAVANGSHNFPP